jgi:hypothetical protein
MERQGLVGGQETCLDSAGSVCACDSSVYLTHRLPDHRNPADFLAPQTGGPMARSSLIFHFIGHTENTSGVE